MSKVISKIIMGLVFVAGGAFSAWNNFALFQSIFGQDMTGTLYSAAGLALFDVGELGGLLHCAHGARGNAQRAIAAAVGLLCLVLTLVAAGTHIILTQTLVTVPAWAGLVAMVSILVGLALNIIGLAANHLASPEIMEAMRQQAQDDERADTVRQAQNRVASEAMRQTAARIAGNAANVADTLSREFAADAERELLSLTSGGDNRRPALPAPLADAQANGPRLFGQNELREILEAIAAQQPRQHSTPAVTTVPAVQFATDTDGLENLTVRPRARKNGAAHSTAPVDDAPGK